MKRIVFTIFVLLIWGSALFGAEIKVSKFIKTTKEKICLGDIVQGKGIDPAWRGIVLAHITSPGSTIELPASYIKARLRLKGVPVDRIKIKLPEVVKIKREGIRITKKDLEAIAKRCIKKNNPWGSRLRILKVKATKDLILPKGKLSYSCQMINSPLGNFSVPIIFRLNGEIISKTWVMAKTRLVTPVVVARYPIMRGEIITKDKLKIIKRDITGLPEGIFLSKDLLVGKRAKINIGIGKIIYKNMVEIPPAVKRGQRVLIVAESDTLRVTAPGVAKENGRIGDLIKVQNLLSKKVVVGKVMDAQTVKVRF